MKVCLNMIVRNEADRMLRCLEPLVGQIDCWSITDTGSTDGTPKIIRDFFAKHNVPGEIFHEPFLNFEQARNAALTHCRSSLALDFDYILLCDADMSLVVKDAGWKKELDGGAAYECLQRGGSLTYFNKRLVRRWEKGLYRGITHEYLDVPSSGWLHGIEFKDWGDGSNRKDKFVRDIRLLYEGLGSEPDNARYWYYLAASYKDAGDFKRGAEAYKQRALMGGWEEEVWHALYSRAHCLLLSGDHAGFVEQATEAFNRRPSRAEPCYLLARYYREKGMNEAALVWAETGLKIPYPQDRLFVVDYVYSTGLLEEFSICAFYSNPQRKALGFAATNKLMLQKEGTDNSRNQARNNVYHYLAPLKARCPSFNARKLDFVPPDGYTPMNPSVVNFDGKLKAVLRTVNYEIDAEGRYLIKGTDGSITNDNPIHTRNYLVTLRPDDFGFDEATELLPPKFRDPAYKLVIGFEDCRLFEYQGGLCVSACMRQHTVEGRCEQVFARIGADHKLFDWHRMLTDKPAHEKNWMPRVKDGELQFFYRLGTLVDDKAKIIRERDVPLSVDRVSGGSQAIQWNDGWVALVHEAIFKPGTQRRYYLHRFVYWDKNSNLRRVSSPFFFNDRAIEFAAGLAFDPTGTKAVISYGFEDKEAWIATITVDEMHDMVFND